MLVVGLLSMGFCRTQQQLPRCGEKPRMTPKEETVKLKISTVQRGNSFACKKKYGADHFPLKCSSRVKSSLLGLGPSLIVGLALDALDINVDFVFGGQDPVVPYNGAAVTRVPTRQLPSHCPRSGELALIVAGAAT